MALQLLLGAATTQEWLGHSLFEIASKPSCPFCYDIDGWAANPLVHLLAHCQRVGTAIDCTHHHATRRVIRVLGLAGALYAFSGEVAQLLWLILAALDSKGLVASGVYWGADAEVSSVGTTSDSWWSSDCCGEPDFT